MMDRVARDRADDARASSCARSSRSRRAFQRTARRRASARPTGRSGGRWCRRARDPDRLHAFRAACGGYPTLSDEARLYSPPRSSTPARAAGSAVAIAARDERLARARRPARAPRALRARRGRLPRAPSPTCLQRGRPRPRRERVRHRAMHDPLTGLPNRALALDRLEGALARRRRDGRASPCCSPTSTSSSSSTTRSATRRQRPARRPRAAPARRMRPSDTSRLGGDEFLVVCEQLDGAHEAIRVAERVAQAIDQPIVLATGEHFITASIGIAVAESADADARPTCCATPTPPCTAPRSAAAAATSCSTTCCASACSAAAHETELRRAIEQGELRVVYQPVVELADGTRRGGRGARALAAPAARAARPGRLHPRRRGVRPDRRARRLGARRPRARRRRAGSATSRAPSRCSCASTPARASSPTPRSRARGRRDGRHGLRPARCARDHRERADGEAHAPVTVLASLREFGLRLMLDDFGTGYSSLVLPQAVPARRAQDRPLVRRRPRPRRGGLRDRRRDRADGADARPDGGRGGRRAPGAARPPARAGCIAHRGG